MKKFTFYKIVFIVVMLIFSCSIISAQTKPISQKFTISGYIKDSSNGESLIGSTIYIKELKTG